MARGPSYTDEEKAVIAKVVANSKLDLDEKVAEFFKQCDSDRTPDAVSQKIRKLMSEAKPQTEAAPTSAKRRGRPPKAQSAVAAAPAAPAMAVAAPKRAEHTNGGPVSVDYHGVVLTGSPRKVGELLMQLPESVAAA